MAVDAITDAMQKPLLESYGLSDRDILEIEHSRERASWWLGRVSALLGGGAALVWALVSNQEMTTTVIATGMGAIAALEATT